MILNRRNGFITETILNRITLRPIRNEKLQNPQNERWKVYGQKERKTEKEKERKKKNGWMDGFAKASFQCGNSFDSTP